MDAKKLRNWRPIALLLLAASLISSVTVFFGLFSKMSDFLFPSPKFPIYVGYIHLNGQEENSILADLSENDRGLLFIDAAVNISRASWPTEQFVEQCRDLEIRQKDGRTILSSSVGGQITSYSPETWDTEGLKANCGNIDFEIHLLRAPKMHVASLDVEFYNFSGLFEATLGYQGPFVNRITLSEIDLPPNELRDLRVLADEPWKEIPAAI